MFPKYPTDEKGISITKTNFDGHSDSEYWQAFASEIQRKVKWSFEEGIDEEKIKHQRIKNSSQNQFAPILGKGRAREGYREQSSLLQKERVRLGNRTYHFLGKGEDIIGEKSTRVRCRESLECAASTLLILLACRIHRLSHDAAFFRQQ